MAVTFDFRKFKNLQGNLRKQTRVKIGILKATTKRQGPIAGTEDNAAVGAKHEFGLVDPKTGKRLPVRSFLRMPLKEKYEATLKSTNFFKNNKDIIFKEPDKVPVFKVMGMIGVKVVLEAFKTGGFGKWKPSNFFFKKNHQTLVETSQLMRSITSRVIEVGKNKKP